MGDHFVEDTSEGPDVALLIVRFVLPDFRAEWNIRFRLLIYAFSSS